MMGRRDRDEVHEAFDKQGKDAALKLGADLGLKESTPKTWMATWTRDDTGCRPGG